MKNVPGLHCKIALDILYNRKRLRFSSHMALETEVFVAFSDGKQHNQPFPLSGTAYFLFINKRLKYSSNHIIVLHSDPPSPPFFLFLAGTRGRGV